MAKLPIKTTPRFSTPKRKGNNPVFNLAMPTPIDIDGTPCQENDPEIWFPSGENLPEDVRKIELAKSLCSQCHEVTKCLTFALTNRVRYGIWGGTTEKERESIIRKRTRKVER